MSKEYSEQLICPNCKCNLLKYTDAWKCPVCNFIIYRKERGGNITTEDSSLLEVCWKNITDIKKYLANLSDQLVKDQILTKKQLGDMGRNENNRENNKN